MRIIAAALAVALPTAAAAQNWPSRPVTMVVPSAAGGTGDVLGRVLAPRLTELLGQPVVVENVGGAGGMMGAARVAKAAPDGYQFVYGNIGTHAHSQALYKDPLYNAATDFAPVILITESPTVLVTRKDYPASTLQQFIAHARSHQASMQYGTPGAGSPPHLSCVLLNVAIGVTITHVPYRGGGLAMQDLIAGRNDYQCPGIAIAAAPIENNQIKAIVMLSKNRSPIMPTLPSAQEQGLADFDGGSWNGFFFPKGTPDAIVRRLNEATAIAMDTPAVQKRIADLGSLVIAAERRSPAYLQTFVAREIAKWAAAIKASGVSGE